MSGKQLANPDPLYPLTVRFCDDCSLVQLALDVPASQIFGPTYPYFTSFSKALVDHGRAFVQSALDSGRVRPGDLVVEVGSNDGYLLELFKDAGCRVLGVEPAAAQAAAARARGVEVAESFFGRGTARALREADVRPRLIVANNVMAHVPELHDFVEGLAILCDDDTWVSIENPWVGDLIARCEYDTIYDEHRCYFSTTAVRRLLRGNGLSLLDVEYLPAIHGGSLRWWGRTGHSKPAPRVGGMVAEEQRLGLRQLKRFQDFGTQARTSIAAISTCIRQLRGEGRRVAAYGAAAKGTMLLNLAGLGPDLIDYVVDANPGKQGKWVPGVRVPVWGPDALIRDPPDYLLLLAWNLEAEIVQQEEEYLRRGGKIVIPVPTPRIVGGP